MNEESIKFFRFDTLPSTNDYAKASREREDFFVTAKRQTDGRGTKGRAFSSDEGGVYLTKRSFYEDFPARDGFKIMISAAVAVCEALRFYGLQPKIKWPNDVLVNGKKICGILIENVLSGGNIASSVVGVGLNVCNPLPKELQELATTMSAEGKTPAVDEVANRLARELSTSHTIEEYRKYLGLTGERVTLVFGDERVPATLLSVSDRGELQVDIEGETRLISAGEVSVR